MAFILSRSQCLKVAGSRLTATRTKTVHRRKDDLNDWGDRDNNLQQIIQKYVYIQTSRFGDFSVAGTIFTQLRRAINIEWLQHRHCQTAANFVFCVCNMTMSWYRNAFRITGPVWGESIGHRWVPITKANNGKLSVFFVVCLNKFLKKMVETRVIRAATTFKRCQYNEMLNIYGLSIFSFWLDYSSMYVAKPTKVGFGLHGFDKCHWWYGVAFQLTSTRKSGIQWTSSYHLLHFLNNLTPFIFSEIKVEN